ncbi:hypothetical protein C0J52_20698 [Blattella germanica]|nr:hypothetical protein C0J52_20698 [Blattella germanica]
MQCSMDPSEFPCSVPCTFRLDCGHTCKLTCHVNKDPDHVDCTCTNERNKLTVNNKMAVRLTFEQRNAILTLYWEFENIQEAQRRWQAEFATDPPICQKIASIRDKFENYGTVQDVMKVLGDHGQ